MFQKKDLIINKSDIKKEKYKDDISIFKYTVKDTNDIIYEENVEEFVLPKDYNTERKIEEERRRKYEEKKGKEIEEKEKLNQLESNYNEDEEKEKLNENDSLIDKDNDEEENKSELNKNEETVNNANSQTSLKFLIIFICFLISY